MRFSPFFVAGANNSIRQFLLLLCASSWSRFVSGAGPSSSSDADSGDPASGEVLASCPAGDVYADAFTGISSSDRAQLLRDGYVSLEGALPADLVSRLRSMADRLEEASMAEYRASGNRSAKHAAIFETERGAPVLERVDKILEADPETVLDLLASPAVLAVARDLCGEDCVPIEMDLLYKQQHPNGYVIWHQGAQHARRRPYLNVGVYLDDAPLGDGCLRYVPGTQFEKQDICDLASRHGWDIPGSVDVPARAGDVLVQDMMVLHCSLPKLSEGARRTVYIEFRPAEAVITERSQSEEWAQLRRRWMALVVDRASNNKDRQQKQLNQGEGQPGCRHPWPSEWRARLPEVGEVGDEVAAIAALWEPPIPAHYCHYAVDHPDYPVPARLRG